uniref:Uncharacterized protein n=1 Tax=Arundo donax TaxID=35708 RepID=A0A0A9C5A9_ARUDO
MFATLVGFTFYEGIPKMLCLLL